MRVIVSQSCSDRICQLFDFLYSRALLAQIALSSQKQLGIHVSRNLPNVFVVQSAVGPSCHAMSHQSFQLERCAVFTRELFTLINSTASLCALPALLRLGPHRPGSLRRRPAPVISGAAVAPRCVISVSSVVGRPLPSSLSDQSRSEAPLMSGYSAATVA